MVSSSQARRSSACWRSSYGLYAAVAFLVFGLLAFALVLLPFGITARRNMAHFAAQAFFRLAGMPVRLLDAQHLPAGPCVVVANHASYLDGVVLKAALPARFSFVIKKEVSRVPLAGLLLRRIGSEFVDRFNRHAGGMDARRLFKAARRGPGAGVLSRRARSSREPGLGKFHTGAFAIAARAELPIVPIAIRGTRHILPSGRFLPRPGRIDIQVLPPLGPLAGPRPPRRGRADARPGAGANSRRAGRAGSVGDGWRRSTAGAALLTPALNCRRRPQLSLGRSDLTPCRITPHE